MGIRMESVYTCFWYTLMSENHDHGKILEDDNVSRSGSVTFMNVKCARSCHRDK